MRGHRAAQHRSDGGLRVAAVDDDGKVALSGERQVTLEGILLDVERRIVPIAVQARLADGDDSGAAG